MNLQKIAVLTGLSVATVLGSGALSPAHAILLNEAEGITLTGNNSYVFNEYFSANASASNSTNWGDYDWVVEKLDANTDLINAVLLSGSSVDGTSAATYTYSYSIKTPSNSTYFSSLGLSFGFDGVSVNNAKTIVWTDGYEGVQKVAELTSTGFATSTNFTGTPNLLYVQTSFTMNSGSGYSLNSISNTVSTVSAVPVPWETDALPLVGATMAFGAGVFAKRKIAQAKSKNLNFEPVKSECLSNVG